MESQQLPPNPYLHVIGVDPQRIMHVIRFDNADWTPTGNVEEQAGNPGLVTSVATAAEGTILHVFVATTESIFHAIRNSDGGWMPFENIARKSGEGWLGASQVAAAIVNGDIHLCGVSRDGRLIHAIFSNGAWTPPRDMFEPDRRPIQTFFHVSCTDHNNELFVAAAPIDYDVILFTRRHQDGTWDPMLALWEYGPNLHEQTLRVACASVLQDVPVRVVRNTNGSIGKLVF